jgi:hypothetical protein
MLFHIQLSIRRSHPFVATRRRALAAKDAGLRTKNKGRDVRADARPESRLPVVQLFLMR